MSERKRKTYLDFKDESEIIRRLKDGESVASLAKRYCVSQSKIYSIKRNPKSAFNLLEDCETQEFAGYSLKSSPKKVKQDMETETSLPKWKSQQVFNVKHEYSGIASDPSSDVENEKVASSSTPGSSFFENDLLDIKEENDTGEGILLVSDPPSFTDEQVESQEKATLILSNDPIVRMEELLSLEESSENVLCSSLEKFQEIISNFETDTYTKYIITTTKGAFVEDEVPFMQRRVRWWEGGNLSGVPYIIAGTRYFSCRFGAPTHPKVLEEYAKKREEKHKLGLCKRYKKGQGTKKLGCPVKFTAHRLLIFPELQVHGNETCSEREKKEIKKCLKKNFSSFRFETRYTCVLPGVETHKFHYTGPSSANKEPMDDRILQKIKTLVASGKTDPDDVAESLEDFAKFELKVDDKDRRKFFPKRLDIMNAINRAKLKIRFDPKEQESIKSMQSSWGAADEVFLRPMKLTKEGYLEKEHPEKNSTFLFVYQNREMKRLYRLYANNALFLDAVHRTCEYAWPFYLLIVNTNSNYQVVGFFVTQHESKVTIAEGLRVIKAWNPSVYPDFAIVNRPWEELKALDIVYPETKTFVSAYHRVRAWRKKIQRRENDGVDREEVLFFLRQVAEAPTERELRRAITQLKDNESYNSSTMKTYYECSWHLQLKRWCAAYKPGNLLFDVNDGVHRLKDDIRYDYLSQFKSKPLSYIINAFITNYIPPILLSYKKENSKMLRRSQIYSGIPPCLRHCSEWVLEQVFLAHFEATEESEQYFVQYVSENSFMISYVDSSKIYDVRFEPFNKMVSCNCSSFTGKVICKHVLIAGLKFSEWHLSRISSWLFQTPIHKVDLEHQSYQNNESDTPEEVFLVTESRFSRFDDDGINMNKFKHLVLNKNKPGLKDDFTDHFVEHDGTELKEMVIEIDKIS